MMRLFLAMLVIVCGCKKAAPVPTGPQPPITHESGLITQVLVASDGDEAKKGDKVQVHYVGALLDGGVFDSSRTKGTPFAFWVGERQVIEGWDEGILGMREGELRRLTVPPALGYGSDKKPGIPPNSTLVFEVELIDVR